MQNPEQKVNSPAKQSFYCQNQERYTMPQTPMPPNIPRKGFIKMPTPGNIPLSPASKVILMRRGNALFNQGKVREASRIFMTIGYTDGLIRSGDAYYQRGEILEALKMYKAAPSPAKVNMIMERTALVIRAWLEKGEETGTDNTTPPGPAAPLGVQNSRPEG